MINYDDDYEYLDDLKFEQLKVTILECKATGWFVKDILAEIYNLWQDYMLSDEQESELYKLVDPDDEYDSPGEYWWHDHGCLPIWQSVQ